MANGARGELHVEAELVRHELFLGVEHHFLGDLFAGVGGGAGHHGGEGGLDHALAGVERFAVTNGGVHFIVLSLVAVVAAFAVGAGIPAPHQSILVGEYVEFTAGFTSVFAFGSVDAVPDAVLAVIHLAAEMVALGAVGPGELDAEVVVDVAFFFAAVLAATVGDGVGGDFVVLGPEHFVDAVHGLLHDVITGEPSEVVPAPEHVFDVGLGVFPIPIDIPFAGVVVVARENGLQIAQIASENFLVRVALRVGPAPDEAIDDGCALFFGFLDGFHHRMHAGRVGGHRFLGEDVFTGINGGFDVLGAEAWRGGEQHDVHAAIDNFLIGINPHEHAFLYTVADFAGMIFLDALEAGLSFILKGFADGVEFDVGIRRERLVDGAGTAAAAADPADLQLGAVGLSEGDGGECDSRCAGGGGGGFNEIAAGGIGLLTHGENVVSG